MNRIIGLQKIHVLSGICNDRRTAGSFGGIVGEGLLAGILFPAVEQVNPGGSGPDAVLEDDVAYGDGTEDMGKKL
jgi:hypothetical protein